MYYEDGRKAEMKHRETKTANPAPTRFGDYPPTPPNSYKHRLRHAVIYLDKLWLNRRGVDAFVMEETLHFLGDAHVVAQVEAANVSRRDDSVASQLPHVELMNGQHSFHLGSKMPVGLLQSQQQNPVDGNLR